MREDWKYSTIGECCNINYGTRVVRKRDGGSIYDVYGGGGATFKMDTYNREDCLVVSRFAMSPKCTRFVSGKFFLNDSGLTLSPKEDSGLSEVFMNTILLANNDNIYEYGRGSAQRNLKVDEFCTMPIAYPKSLSEQERIVSLLDAQFAKIDALKANAASQLQAAKDLFQSALKQLLTPQKGWEEKKLYELYDVRDGTHDSPKYVEEGYPLVTSKNLKNGGIDMTTVKYIKKSDYEKINERSKVDVGDVLFAMIGTIGNPSLVEDEPNYAIKNMALFKVPRCQNSKFLKYILSSDEIINRMKGQASGSNQPFVSLGYLRNFTIQIPSLPEQERIAARLDTISEKVKALQANYDQTITLCNDLKQSLLKSIFA